MRAIIDSGANPSQKMLFAMIIAPERHRLFGFHNANAEAAGRLLQDEAWGGR
jgi:hypothetical protein